MHNFSKYNSKPILFISKHPNTNKYTLQPEAISFLKSVPPPIAFITVMGIKNTGSNNLLNTLLLNNKQGFGMGQKCKKGLYCWGAPIQGRTVKGESVNIIVMDSILDEYEQNKRENEIYLNIGLWSSSNLIYKWLGDMKQGVIQNLMDIWNVYKYIEKQQDGKWIWVIKGEQCDKNEKQQQFVIRQIQQQRKMRKILKELFKQKAQYLQIFNLQQKPINNQNQIIIQKTNQSQIINTTNLFKNNLINNITLKSIDNNQFTPQIYLSFLTHYLQNINQSNHYQIITPISISQHQIISQCLSFFHQSFQSLIQYNFGPRQSKYLRIISQTTKRLTIQLYYQKTKYHHHPYLLQSIIQNQIQFYINHNQKDSQFYIQSQFIKACSPFQKKLKQNYYKQFKHFQSQFEFFYNQYKDKLTNLPNKQKIIEKYYRNICLKVAKSYIEKYRKQIQKQKRINEQWRQQYKRKRQQEQFRYLQIIKGLKNELNEKQLMNIALNERLNEYLNGNECVEIKVNNKQYLNDQRVVGQIEYKARVIDIEQRKEEGIINKEGLVMSEQKQQEKVNNNNEIMQLKYENKIKQLQNEILKLKLQKQQRHIQYLNKLQSQKNIYKHKLKQTQQTLKLIQTQKRQQFFHYQTFIAKFQIQLTHKNYQIQQFKQTNQKLLTQQQKYIRLNQMLKLQTKYNKTHFSNQKRYLSNKKQMKTNLLEQVSIFKLQNIDEKQNIQRQYKI